MFAAKAGQRFSLLLLEEGEAFVRDYVATADWPEGVSSVALGRSCLPGQLRLATKSLFFEPDDLRVPIVRLPFAAMQGMEGQGDRVFELFAQRWTKMKSSAADHPFVYERGGATWRFRLQHSTLADFMPLAQQMLLASRLPEAEAEEMLEGVCAAQEAGARFDVGHLRSPGDELVLAELPATLVTPLAGERGRLALTGRRLYFQPLHNVSGDAVVHSHPLEALAAVARRRAAGLRDVGMEVFFAQPAAAGAAGGVHSGDGSMDASRAPPPYWGAPSALFSFASTEERDAFLSALAQQPALGTGLAGGPHTATAAGLVLEAEGGWLGRVTSAWQRGALSNFQYLLFLNAAAGRTFNDLSQYPVFPWVVADYTSPVLDLSDPATFRDLSKPVGALNPRRLAALKQRYHDMPHDDPANPPFLYATHYSTPGYVMFWLLRAAPAHMLRLQSGRFDAPDRLFCSVAEAWEGVVSTNPTDVKELIPEFFMASASFLLNDRGLPLGVRQGGRPVGDVELPPWAEGDPSRFLALHRAALEAPFVSANLHHWIDLVFGYKQQGTAALEADNVFRHITHAGAVDLEALPDPVERRALLAAIQEFGQSPRAIFDRPHPRRLVAPPPPPSEQAFAGPGERGGSGQAVSLALVSAVLAAAADAAAAQAPLEVPEQLGQLDVAAWRRAQEAAAAAAAAAAGAEARSSSRAEPSEAPSSQADDAASEQSVGSPSRASPGARLKQLVGGVKQAAAATASAVVSPADKATSAAAASLRGLFTRSKSSGAGEKDPAESSEPSEEHSPSSSSLMDRWKAFTGSKSSRSLTASEASGTAATVAEPPAHEPTASQRQASSSGSGATAAAAAAVAGAGVVLKQSRRKVLHPASSSSSSEDEAEGQQSSTPLHSPRSLRQNLPDEQRLRMLGLSPGKIAAAAAEPGGWGPGMHDRLQQGCVAALGGESVHAVALAGVGPQRYAYAALASGGLRVLDLDTSQQLRAAPLGSQPLASLALVPQAPSGQSRAAQQHPLVLAASYDGHVRAYQVESGRCMGSWQAHADTVSCLEVLCDGAGAAGPSSLATASWDGSVRLWELAEGRQPWRDGGGGGQLVADLGSGVWALAAGGPGSQLLLTGTEDGLVALHDRRAPTTAWEQPLSDDYISSLDFISEPRSSSGSSSSAAPGHAVVASGDGSIALLDLRKAGVRLSFASCGAPLRCLATDGSLALAGGEDGALHIWDVASALGRPAPRGRWSRPDPGGLYPALEAAPLAAVNALAVTALGGDLVVAVGHDGGLLRTWRAPLALGAQDPRLT